MKFIPKKTENLVLDCVGYPTLFSSCTRAVSSNTVPRAGQKNRGASLSISQVFIFLGYILSLFLLPLFLHAQEAGSLHSKHASFDGNVLTLTGNVELHHGLGTLLAEEATLYKQEAHQDFPFSRIDLHKGVELLLKDRAQLTCTRAELDFLALKGALSGEEEKIIYAEQMKPLRITGRRADFTCVKKESADEYALTELCVQQEVCIEYALEYALSAERTVYDKTQPERPRLTAYPKDAAWCRLSRGQDTIDARLAELDIRAELLELQEPQGTLAPSAQCKNGMTFRAHHLSWDHHEHLLTLQEEVAVDEPILGHLFARERLVLTQGEQSDFAHIDSYGYTKLSCIDQRAEEEHNLTCPGKMHVDRTTHVATFDRSEAEQLFYQGKECTLFADHATAEYAVSEGHASLARVNLNGRIRLHSPNGERTGIADRATYSPLTHTLILSADPGSRVLFYDAKENVQMHAPEVHLIQDPEHNRTTAKGIGTVRFTLSEEELKELLQ